MNTILTPQIIANESLMALNNNLVVADLVHRDYQKEFVKVGDTVNVRKPAKFVAQNFTGETQNQDVTEEKVAVKMDHFRDVSFAISSLDMTLSVKDFSARYLTPAMQAIAQSVDSDLLAEGARTAGSTIASTPDAKDLKDIANVSKAFDLKGVPIWDRRFVMHPTHKYRYLTTDNLSKASYAGTSEALRTAELGAIYKFDTYMSQNAPDTLADKPGTITGAKVSCTAGAKSVKLTEVKTASATIKQGDSFILDGYRYNFMEDATAQSGTVEAIAISEPIHKTISSEKAEEIYIVTKTHSIAFQRNGLALVTRNLELPMGAAKAAIVSSNGLSVRVVFGYNQKKKQDEISIDIIYGVKTLDPNMVARMVG